MSEFLQENASAIFGLIGALGTVIVGFAAAWFLRKRDYDLRLWDKLLERRIEAHEHIIEVALEMRVMVSLGGVDADGEVSRAPRVLLSKNEFEDWFTRAMESAVTASTWLSTDAKREMNYLQDYLVTLHRYLQPIPTEKYLSIGVIVRQDFIDISSSLEKAAFAFYKNDVRRLKLNDLEEWHKYPRERTERRLQETHLLGRLDEFEQYADNDKSED